MWVSQARRTGCSGLRHFRRSEVAWEVVVGAFPGAFLSADLGKSGPPYSCLTEVVEQSEREQWLACDEEVIAKTPWRIDIIAPTMIQEALSSELAKQIILRRIP